MHYWLNLDIKEINIKKKIYQIRESTWFSNLTTSIIIFYALMLGFKTIANIESQFINYFSWLDYTVTLYFFIEIMIKILAEEKVGNFFKSKWNLFDFIIVSISLIPLDNASTASIARLLRVFRVLRLITSQPKLKSTIDVLIKAIPSIVSIVLLIFIIFYIYAIIGNFLFESLPSGVWKDFPTAMLTLFGIITFEGWIEVMNETMTLYSWSWTYFVSFIIIVGYVFLNLFIAVIIGEMEKENTKENDEKNNQKFDLLINQVLKLQVEIQEMRNDQKKNY